MEKAIKKDDNDSRLDRWLHKNQLVNSVVEAQKLVRSGKIRINEDKVKINARVLEGDVVSYPDIRVKKIEKARYNPTKQDKELLLKSVLYKDDNVIVINKPAGLAVQGGSGSFKNLDAMLDVLKFDSDIRPKLVHRLDKHTSGAFVIARNNQSAKKLQSWFKNKNINKVYWAMSLGAPSKNEGVIDAPLLKKLGGNEKVIVSDDGKEARTGYKVLKKYAKTSLIECYPETGRMHQIRVHLNYIGHPIIGDGKYGGKRVYLKNFDDNMHLHAKSISFPNPENEEKTITVEADAPSWFK